MFCNGKDAFRTLIIQLLREEKRKRKNVWKNPAHRLGERRFSLGDSQRGREQNAAGDVPTGRARAQGWWKTRVHSSMDGRMATAHPQLDGWRDSHGLDRALEWMENPGTAA